MRSVLLNTSTRNVNFAELISNAKVRLFRTQTDEKDHVFEQTLSDANTSECFLSNQATKHSPVADPGFDLKGCLDFVNEEGGH